MRLAKFIRVEPSFIPKNVFLVSRDKGSKYYIPETLYYNPYPPFCHGGLSTLGFPILEDIYESSRITNMSGFHLEDVYITGILRSKLNRGHLNIKPFNYKEARHKFQHHVGPFSWHLPPQKMDHVWQIVFNLMTVSVEKKNYTGYWPSANIFYATSTKEITTPAEILFEEKFGSVEYT